jgi:hypothetical protein
MPSQQWTQVEPVLQATWRLAEERITGSAMLNIPSSEIALAMGESASEEQVALALDQLAKAGYLDVMRVMGPDVFVEGFTEKGLQLVAGWPTGPAEAMMNALLESIEQQIQGATSEEQRTRLERFREAATGMGRELLLRVLTQAATGQI